MTKRFFLVLVSLSLAACQSLPALATTPTLMPPSTPLPIPTGTSVQPPTAADPVLATPTITALPASAADQAKQTVRAYFAALSSGDTHTAADLTSTFSLVVDHLTRSDWAAALAAQITGGAQWSGLQILGAEPFPAPSCPLQPLPAQDSCAGQTVLVHVHYQVSGLHAAPTPLWMAPAINATPTVQPAGGLVDEFWPVRFEGGRWLYNRANLIDFHTLDAAPQVTAGLLIQPRELLRYSDRIRLVFLAQNSANEAIVLGQPNEILASFHLGGQTVQAAPVRLVFDRLRSYPDAAIDVPGLFTAYPDGVEIRRWKDLQVRPWFNFQFSGS